MGALDIVALTILFGALIALAGILSSVVAMRFGAPLLLVFLLIGVLAGESGPGGIAFDNVDITYTVGALALGLILFDGGLRTRFQTFRSVIAPAGVLATLGVFVTAAIIAPVAVFTLSLTWLEGLLLGTVIASTDAAAVFFLLHAQGLRLRPRVSATLEVESGTNDPLAIFLTVMLVEIVMLGNVGWFSIAQTLTLKMALGAAFGIAGGHAIVFVLNRMDLPQGLHAPFVATGAVVAFSLAEVLHGSGYLAAYVAGLIVGNRPTRAHNTVVVFLDAITWLAQIAMFVLLGLLAWPSRLPDTLAPALLIAVTLMLVARPAAVFLCLWPFRFSARERLYISWVGLRGAVGIFLASIPLLVGMPKGTIYFDVAFVVVAISLLVQGWTIGPVARRLGVALPRVDAAPRRVELDLPGQLAQELVGYAVTAKSLYFRQRIVPSWAKLALIVRQQRVLSPNETDEIHEDDYVYFLAPPEKAQALDRFFVQMPAPVRPDMRLLGDFFVPGDTTLGALAEIYGLKIAGEEMTKTLSALFQERMKGALQIGARLPIGSIQLIADSVVDGRVATVGLDLAEGGSPDAPETWMARAQAAARKAFARAIPS